jgi:hypothetical protein
MRAGIRKIILSITVVFSVFAAGVSFAGVEDTAKQIEKIVRNAERQMFNGKNDQADEMLQEAAALIEQGKTEDSGNKKLQNAEKKYQRLRGQVDKKLGRTAVKTSSRGPALPPKPTPKPMASSSAAPSPQGDKAAQGDKLPGGVKKRLGDITRYLDKADRYAQSDAANAQRKLEQAGELFDEIDRTYGGQFDHAHPDFVSVKNRYEALDSQAKSQAAAEAQAAADAEQAKAAMEQQSAEWVGKFRPYLAYAGQQGHDPSKLVFVPGTSEPEKFGQAMRHYEAFKQFYEEYGRTEFPHGKTYQLQELADNEAPVRLKDFEEGMASRMGSVAGDAENQIAAAMAQLEKDNGWKSDPKVKPNLIDSKWMSSIADLVSRVETALGDDPKARAVRENYNALLAKDKQNRQIRRERTFMTPDRYAGSDLEDLKKKAAALVKNDNRNEGGEPLRTTIVAENWREETVEEWTDTSRTTWRKRTTRHMTAQVAARTSDGVRLVTVALAQDRQSDGAWGPLYGNLHQTSDPMPEANVFK